MSPSQLHFVSTQTSWWRHMSSTTAIQRTGCAPDVEPQTSKPTYVRFWGLPASTKIWRLEVFWVPTVWPAYSNVQSSSFLNWSMPSSSPCLPPCALVLMDRQWLRPDSSGPSVSSLHLYFSTAWHVGIKPLAYPSSSHDLSHPSWSSPSPYVVDHHITSDTYTSRAKRHIKFPQHCQSLIIQEWPPLILRVQKKPNTKK